MDTIYFRSLLFDFYGDLLTDKQRDILRMHLVEDLSLSEIADLRGISRQGASDTIHRGLELMEQMEEKLHLTERFIRLQSLTDEIEKKIREGAGQDQILQTVERMRESIALSTNQE